jgi:hypothetical protein
VDSIRYIAILASVYHSALVQFQELDTTIHLQAFLNKMQAKPSVYHRQVRRAVKILGESSLYKAPQTTATSLGLHLDVCSKVIESAKPLLANLR